MHATRSFAIQMKAQGGGTDGKRVTFPRFTSDKQFQARPGGHERGRDAGVQAASQRPEGLGRVRGDGTRDPGSWVGAAGVFIPSTARL